jgi:hypothetical protein
MKEQCAMEYPHLGRTGLTVSSLSGDEEPVPFHELVREEQRKMLRVVPGSPGLTSLLVDDDQTAGVVI